MRPNFKQHLHLALPSAQPLRLLARNNLLPATFLVLAVWLFLRPCLGGPLYLATFETTFEYGIGNLQNVHLNGSYLFELQPPSDIVNEGTTADYESVRAGSLTLDGQSFSATGGYLRVDDNIALNSNGVLRDAYYGVVNFDGIFAGNYKLSAAGLEFEQIGTAPSAFSSLALPTSLTDLAGFGLSDLRLAFLTYEDLRQGTYSAASAPVQNLSITEVPEPTVGALLGVGFALTLLARPTKPRR